MNCLYAMPGQQNREGCEQLVVREGGYNGAET